MKNHKLTNPERRAIYQRDHFRCALCDCGDSLQIHHYIPRGKGGSNSPENLVTLCSICHMQIHGYQPWQEVQMTAEELEQMVVEYLADMYTTENHVWNPYNKSPL